MNETLTAPHVTGRERAAIALVVALVSTLGVLGMVNSFTRVEHAVTPSFGMLAWTVPLGIDIGIAAFTGLDLVLAHLGMRAGWLRAFPWLLVAATIYLNVADETTTVGAVAHAVLPGLWIIAVEAGSHAVRMHTGMTRARDQIDRVRWSRWVLSPVTTIKLWRRMVLWEVTDYTIALARERDRVLARCDLADEYGRVAWRWRAPRRERVLYRLGELMPARVLNQAGTPGGRDETAGQAGAPGLPARPAGPVLTVAPPAGHPGDDLARVLAAVDELHAKGATVTGGALGRALGVDDSNGRKKRKRYQAEIDRRLAELDAATADVG